MLSEQTWATPDGAVITLRASARWLEGPDGTRAERIEIGMGRTRADEGVWWRAVRPNGRAYSSMWNQRGWVRELRELADLGVELESLVERARWTLVVAGADGAVVSRTPLGTEPDLGALDDALAAVGAEPAEPAAA